MMENIVDELLSEPTETAEPTPEVVETPEPDAEKPAETPETGEKTVEPPSTESVKTVPESALVGLRKDLTSKIKSLEEQLAAKPEEAAPKPSVFEDEEAAFTARGSEIVQQVTNELLNAGQAEAIRQYDAETVDKAVEWVMEAAKTSPMLASELASTSPLEQHRKVVELWQAEQARAELENPEQLKARLKEEARQELLAEQEAAKQEKENLAKSIPESLVGDSSAGSLTGSDWAGPTSLEAVVGPGG